MIKTLEDALERVKSWPPQRQADVARLLEAMEHSGSELHCLTDDERAAVEIGLEQAKQGAFVSDAEMEAFWSRNRK